MSIITFVTAFFNIYNHPSNSETLIKRFDRFKEIAITGIQICIYTEPDLIDTFNELIKEFPNIKLMNPIDLKKSNIAAICSTIDYSLPNIRNQEKDNDEFMMFINTKYELLENAISVNPWNSSYFAWIDFSLSYIFQDLKESQSQLVFLSNLKLTNKFFTIGGWEKTKNPLDKLNNENVVWRFCGGFLLGDTESVKEFTDLSKQYLHVFMNLYKKLTWEVNFWAWLETYIGWKPIWFHTMFNDGIIKIPVQVYCKLLKNSIKTTYNYPNHENFVPSSACHICYKGYHFLNTRYINYLIRDDGSYHYLHNESHIISKNYVSLLNKNFIPNSYVIMDDESVELKQTEYPDNISCNIVGLEDIRLYEYNNKIRFIATNRNYAPVNKNRMIIGDYNIETIKYDNCKIIDSPNDAVYEKNWIPIITNNIESVSDTNIQEKVEYFIYSWCPMDICKINPETNNLVSVKKYYNTIYTPNFNRVRGSSTFIDIGEFLLGVVHFSDDIVPRNYYHMLVALNKTTLCPIKYSQPFCFQHIGIEFCIGFWKQDNNYLFWTSKIDRNPCMIKIDVNEIPLCFDFSDT
jgi:hypothetical protein